MIIARAELRDRYTLTTGELQDRRHLVRVDERERAVELLEQGRAVLLGRALDDRTDLTSLAERHPRLAEQFIAVRDALEPV